jgi:light-regulated signal transduction histidine kinase (bacteriophytochrome)
MEFESFSKSVKYSKENYAVVFLPIKNISGDSVAWLVQYNKDDFFHKNVSSFLINLSSVTILIWILFIIFRKMRDQKLQLESLNRDLESNVKERTTELENVVKELEDFNYNIAHDLRTPLRAMNGFSRILLSEYGEKIDDEGKRLLNVISGNAVRMGKLIDGILYFSQLRRMKKTCVTIDMNSLTREVWNELQFLEIEIGRKVDFKLLDMQPLYADPGMIRQAIKNLISNAIKFTRDRDMAQIEAGSIMQNNEVVYFVKDNGCGFDMQYYQRLFGVFSRLHGIEEYEGTGIGLAVVKRIILKHNGKVWADGKLDKGATFYFSLPVGLDKVDH